MDAQNEAKAVRLACCSITSCNPAVVADLSRLLSNSDIRNNEKSSSSSSRATKHAQASKKAVAASRKPLPNGDSKSNPDGWTSKDQHILATEIVNTTLKTLTDCVKAGIRVKLDKKDDSDQQQSGPGTKRSGQPLSEIPNLPAKPKSSIKQASKASESANHASQAGLAAIAECARIAFSWLRAGSQQRLSVKPLPSVQLEQGMLALSSKLIAVGLVSYALKELRILKRRFEANKSLGDKETLANLLDVELEDATPEKLAALTTYHNSILKIISSSASAPAIEEVATYLDVSNQRSPSETIMKGGQGCSEGGRTAKQLESLAQNVLAISIEADRHPQVSAECAFTLRTCALQIRQKWWQIARHRPDLERELFNPFVSGLETFLRRSAMSKAQQYSFLKELYTKTLSSHVGQQNTHSYGSLHKTLHVLSVLSDEIGLDDESSSWIKSMACNIQNGSGLSKALSLLRAARRDVESAISSGKPLASTTLTRIKDMMQCARALPSSELSIVQTEMAPLRKGLLSLIRDTEGSDSLQAKEGLFTACRMVFGLLEFLSQLARPPKANGVHNTMVSDQQQEQSNSNAGKQIVELAIFASKICLSTDVPLPEVRAALQHCVDLLPVISTRQDTTLHIHASAMFWLLYQTATNQPDQDQTMNPISFLRSSVDLLMSLPKAEQRSAFLWTKLERLCRVLYESQSYRDCHKRCIQLAGFQIKSGLLESAAELFKTAWPLSTLTETPEVETLHRSLMLHHRSAVKLGSKRIYYLDTELPPDHKAALLELQLPSVMASLSKHTQNEQIQDDLHTLLQQLFFIYDSSKYHIRKSRLARHVLLFDLSNPKTLRPSMVSTASETKISLDDCGKDNGLERFIHHAKHALQLAIMMHADSQESTTWADALAYWQEVRHEDKSSMELASHVDDVDGLLELLHTAASFLAIHGSDQLHLQTLRLISGLSSSESSEAVRAECDLVSLCLKLGLFQEAHQRYHSVGVLVKSPNTNPADRLRLHLTHLELAAIEGAFRTAHAAFVSFNKQASVLSQQKSDRLFLYKCQADAGRIMSCVFRDTGRHVQSLHYAKEATRLYRSLAASLEHVATNRKDEADTSDAGVGALVQTFESLVIAPKKKTGSESTSSPAVKASMWQFGPGLFRAMIQISELYAYEGMRSEAEYYAIQASKFAQSLRSCGIHLQLHTLQLRHACGAGGSRPERTQLLGQFLIQKEEPTASLDLVRYHVAEGDLLAKFGDSTAAVAEYDRAGNILSAIKALVKDSKPVAPKTDTASRGRATARKNAAVHVRKPVKAAATKTTGSAKRQTVVGKTQSIPRNNDKSLEANPGHDCELSDAAVSLLDAIHSTITRQRALALLESGQQADINSHPSEQQLALTEDEVKNRLLSARSTLAQVTYQITSSITYNALPESTLALPALHSQRSVEESTIQPSPHAPGSVPAIPSTKSGRRQTTKVPDPGVLLLEARSKVAASLASTIASKSIASAYQIGSLNTSITFLLSAISTVDIPADFVHPTRLAHSRELPSLEASQRQINAVAVEKQEQTLQDLLARYGSVEQTEGGISAARFQRDCIDILPSAWTAISIGMNEDCSELWLARYAAEHSPFVLRLPMARHKANEIEDEMTFDFEAGRAELRDIIECSDYSCHHAPDTSTKNAKSAWWTEREALDERMKELLVNMENIWFGGFKGILSQHTQQPSLLARFRKSLDLILDRHLPSRQGPKSQSKNLVLDSHVLELFIGLGETREGGDDIEEHVLDLLYFVVDLLQFNGEPNAYDEVDFDSMTVETVEAMRAYHNADNLVEAPNKHTILVLDKRLHAFPWESMPCLQDISVSRVGNMLHLRERILALRQQQAERQQKTDDDMYFTSRTSGTFILNPSGDLKRTQETLSPHLESLRKSQSWTALTNSPPTEKAFSQALSTSSTLLYFGHGSGAQFIRNRSIRKLDRCAPVVWLMGCSSGTVTENGDFEPASVPLSYLVAGESPALPHLRTRDSSRENKKDEASSENTNDKGRKGLCMSVLATLWDVTDKDIDRFSIRVGQSWGLFASDLTSASRDAGNSSAMEPPKTPAARRRGVDTVSLASKAKTPSAKGRKTPGRTRTRTVTDEDGDEKRRQPKMSLVQAVAESREACYLRYLNGAAAVVYGVPVYLGD